MRGNGGILMRLIMLPSIPFFGITFYGAAPTNSPVDENGDFVYPTVDYAQQYDGLGGDFPYRPLNLLALVNSLLGYAFLHGGVVNKPSSEALFQGKEGDTSYYLFPTEVVPVLMPLQMIGVPKPILSFFDTFLRVLIEDAYLRDVNPGVPTAANLLPIGDPIGLVLKLLAAIPVAIDNALEDLGLGRPLGTTEPGPFGVGGPPLPAPPSALSTTTVSRLAAQTEIEGDNAESSVLEAQSLMSEQQPEPSADSEPVVDVNEETELVDPDPTTEEQVETTTEEQTETATPEPTETPAATDPDQPEVRGPIEFDSPEPQPDSPSNNQDDVSDNETAPDPSPTGADNQDNQDNQDDQNDDQDAAA